MPLSKSDIDALVDGMCPRVDYLVEIAGSSLFSGDVRRAMYKAAGLTAEGQRKPERVRCWLISDSEGRRRYSWFTEPTSLDRLDLLNMDCTATPGWFVPSEEGE